MAVGDLFDLGDRRSNVLDRRNIILHSGNDKKRTHSNGCTLKIRAQRTHFVTIVELSIEVESAFHFNSFRS